MPGFEGSFTVIAAILSAFFAGLSYFYSREKSKATLTLSKDQPKGSLMNIPWHNQPTPLIGATYAG